ncbi:unnamed protein product [Arabidopsis lyrata]|nr:unnamed protein product [Arabidopsis lyrata]
MLLKTEGAGGDESRGEREDVNGIDRENATDGDGMECLENDGIDNVNAAEEEHTMSAQEQEHEQSLDKGDKMVARELEDYLLEIQRHIDPSIRRGEEPNTAINHSVDVTPQPTRVNRTGTRGQDHNEATDNVNEKGSDSQRTWYGKSWKDIKNGNPAVFAEKTELDGSYLGSMKLEVAMDNTRSGSDIFPNFKKCERCVLVQRKRFHDHFVATNGGLRMPNLAVWKKYKAKKVEEEKRS